MEFVLCDDEKQFRIQVKNIIDKLLMKSNDEYFVKQFDKYDKEFEKVVKTRKPKIYILDIEIKDSISGIDIARKIRKNDWESIIILVTSHNELGFQALKAQIMLLDFISKYDDCEKNLESTLRKAMSLVNMKKTIKFETAGISYVIHIDDILYIEKDTVERKCIIKTTYNEIPVNKTLSSIANELGDKFYLSHRSCLVNTLNISKIDWRNNIIHFRGGSSIDLISRDKRKGLKEYVNS